jgi:carbonic anhydrase/acetyltransferase-like protein (isoleucine patch superfamily)
MAEVGLGPRSGVRIGDRVILAHGSEVRGPARVGVDASELEEQASSSAAAAADVEDSGVFLSFGARIDGAVVERDTALSALSRVGPGVRLRSGLVVLPGKNVTTQEQADNPALGKVRPLIESDVAFNAAVVEVNVGLASTISTASSGAASPSAPTRVARSPSAPSRRWTTA